MKTREIMTRDVQYIDSATTLKEAATLMREKDIGALPVGENEKLIGFLTDRDITVKAIANGFDPKTTTVKQVMTPKCLYCFENDSVEETAKNMSQNQVRRLPVLNTDKKLVGIVTLADISLKDTIQHAGQTLQGICKKS